MSINHNYQCTVPVHKGICGASPDKFLNERQQKGREFHPPLAIQSFRTRHSIAIPFKEFAGTGPANS
jgi:hypothetical protein